VLLLREGQVASAKCPGEPFGCGVEREGWGILCVKSSQGVRGGVRPLPCPVGREDIGGIPGDL